MQCIKNLLGLAALAVATGVLAQNYPTRPVTMLVPYAAGGPTDTVARVVAQAMMKPLGQTMLVENRPSAGGFLAPEQVKNAKPDGYTILIHHIGMATIPALYRSARFNPLTDFEYIGLVNDVPMAIIARQNFPAKDFKEFLSYIKANKEKVTLANAGIGAASHLCGLLFMSAIQTNFLTVPYKGTGPAMNDLLGGQLDYFCGNLGGYVPLVQAKQVKAIALLSRERSALMPELATAHEQGMADLDVVTWTAFFLPKGAPKAVVDKLIAITQAAMDTPAIKTRMLEIGVTGVAPARRSPEYLAKFVVEEIERWEGPIKAAGLQVE